MATVVMPVSALLLVHWLLTSEEWLICLGANGGSCLSDHKGDPAAPTACLAELPNERSCGSPGGKGGSRAKSSNRGTARHFVTALCPT